MTDLARERYARLMTEIDKLENYIAELESNNSVDKIAMDKFKEELARISDGCPKPHPM